MDYLLIVTLCDDYYKFHKFINEPRGTEILPKFIQFMNVRYRDKVCLITKSGLISSVVIESQL